MKTDRAMVWFMVAAVVTFVAVATGIGLFGFVHYDLIQVAYGIFMVGIASMVMLGAIGVYGVFHEE